MDNDFILIDRLQKIKQIVAQNEEDFYIAFSGGKDSTILHYLIDMALPNNKIPRVYINTGMEYKLIVDFVKELQQNDNRIIILQNKIKIKKTLSKYGYPFKSKVHSSYLNTYQKSGATDSVIKYVSGVYSSYKTCPKKLLYQFSNNFTIPISSECCNIFKKSVSNEWKENNNKKSVITGIRKEEGGQRTNSSCVVYKDKQVYTFNPLIVISNEWENWFIEKYNIKLCDLYYPPYNFERTGCKGCPFNIYLDKELKTMKELLPNEYKQCELLWKPIYNEYRRIGYRLK